MLGCSLNFAQDEITNINASSEVVTIYPFIIVFSLIFDVTGRKNINKINV